MQNIHPLIIHFPIALFLTAIAFELVAFIRKNESFVNIAAKLFILSAVAFIVAAITGLIAENSVPHNEQAHAIMQNHKFFQLIATGISVLIAAVTFFSKKGIRILRFILALICAGFMTYGSYLGGELVYKFGIGTNIEITKPDGNKRNEQSIKEIKKDSLKTEEQHDEHEHKH
jgi:uncharacterized membrane protein